MNLLIRPLYNFEDFCAIINDGQKADLIDGIIYMSLPDNTAANELNMWLVAVLTAFVLRRDLGKVYASRVAFRLDNRNGPEPDIGFVKKSRLRLIKRGHVLGRPDLAMEIVSPDSIDRDYTKKRQQYERAKVPEYWIVDELQRKITLLRLGTDRRFKEIPAQDGILRSKAMPGFWLNEDWLWATPLPDVLDILELLLRN